MLPVSDHEPARNRPGENPASDASRISHDQSEEAGDAVAATGTDGSSVTQARQPDSATPHGACPESQAESRSQTDRSDLPDWTRLWLRRSDQLFVGILAILLLTLIVFHWGRLSRWGLEPVEIDRLESNAYQFRIDINQASWVEWTQLKGIGPTLAQRIVEDRRRRGPFASIDELDRVKGIGPKTIERIRPWLEVGPR